MGDFQAQEQDKQVKKLKRTLEGWREVVLPLHSVLMWDKQYYPGLLFGAVSSVYFVFWLFDPPLFTTIALMGLLFTLMDYFVPIVISHLYTPREWNKSKEKLYEEICKNMVICYNWLYYTIQSFYRMREVSPRGYYIILVVGLSIFAWLGATVSNLFLSYMVTLYVVFLPGLLNNSTINSKLTQLSTTIGNIVQSNKQKKNH